MHLEGMWLSTISNKSPNQKFKSAEHKKRVMTAKNDWEDLKKRWDIKPTTKPDIDRSVLQSKPEPYRRDTGPRIPSLGSNNAGPCVKQEIKVYTGENMLGISQLHKSNSIPVFSKEEIIDIGKMRR